MKRKILFLSIGVLILFGWWNPAPSEGGFLRISDMGGNGGDGGPYVNLIVREVRVTPARAHAGDPVRIEMTIEHQGEGYGTTTAEVRANGKVVANSLFTYGFGGGPGEIYRKTFLWDTRGVSPGEYRIRGEVFLWHDASEFDNFLDVAEPLVLLTPGQALPAGSAEGATAVGVDPRWAPPARRAVGGSPTGMGGY